MVLLLQEQKITDSLKKGLDLILLYSSVKNKMGFTVKTILKQESVEYKFLFKKAKYIFKTKMF